MSDESESVAPATAPLLNRRSALALTTLWLQRTLLVALVLAHALVPWLFAVGSQGDLIRDVALSAQLSLLLIVFTLLSLTWLQVIAMAIGGAVQFLVWYVLYAEMRQMYVFDALIVPTMILAATLLALRWWGWRGTWNSEALPPTSPWQISIMHLLVVTTAVAVAFAGASWLRQFSGLEADPASDWYWLVVGIDGVGTSTMCLTAIWALGVPGAAFLKFAILLCVAVVLAGCQIFAFQMEDFWHLSAISSLAYVILLAGTLWIWRLCGWRVIALPRRIVVPIQ